MYWGQISGALITAFLVVGATVTQDATLLTATLLGVIICIIVRWGFAWVFRTKYWYRYDSPSSRSCPQCGQYIYRLGGDWVLTCKRCGWRAGWPVLRWITHSVPVNQVRRTVVGPRLVIVIIAVALLVTGVPEQVTESDYSASDVPVPSFDEVDFSGKGVNESEVEQLVFEKLNDRRTEREYATLSYNERAAEKARLHAEDMASKDYFSHTSRDGETQQERYGFCNGGENIHQTWVNKRVQTSEGTERFTSDEELAEAIVTAWMDSDPHRERGIYGEWWSSGGVGISITDDGKVYAVYGFCQ